MNERFVAVSTVTGFRIRGCFSKPRHVAWEGQILSLAQYENAQTNVCSILDYIHKMNS